MGGATIVAATHWAVKSRQLRPSGSWPRLVQRWSDPVIRPFQRRVHRWGGNPQDAPLWLAVAALFAGLALVLLERWLVGTILGIAAMRGAPAAVWLRFVIGSFIGLLMAAILIRVIGSWLGAGRYNRWMRPVYVVTDWIVEPIRRRLPPMGALDLSPVAAYLLLLMLREILLGALR